MSQQAPAGGGDPYSQDRDGQPFVWLAHGPAPVCPAPVRPAAVRGPGWTARILFWAGLAIGPLPEFVMLPMIIIGAQPELSALYSAVAVVCGLLGVIFGIIALLIVRASPLTMRLIGMGLLVIISMYAFFVPHLMPLIVNRAVHDFTLAMSIQSIIWAFHGGVVLAGTLIAWNIARNRTWWTHLVAAGYAMLMGLVVTFVEWAMNVLGSSFATSVVLTQFVSLTLTFVGLGLLHVIGTVRDGSALSQAPQQRYYRPGRQA